MNKAQMDTLKQEGIRRQLKESLNTLIFKTRSVLEEAVVDSVHNYPQFAARIKHAKSLIADAEQLYEELKKQG